MGTTGDQTMTGNGEFLFDDVHLVLTIDFQILTPTVEVDYRSVLIPRRQLHAGWVALASGDVGVASGDEALTAIAVTWSSYIDFEHVIVVNPSGFPYDDRVQWNIPSGITARFNASW